MKITRHHCEYSINFLAKGRLVGCFGLTEANHGSDPEGMQTTAVRKDDHYVINGSKQW